MEKSCYLFDFDGVLVDSMPVWAGTYVSMLRAHGVPVPDGFVRRITPLGNAGAAKCTIEAGLRLSEEEILSAAFSRFDEEYGKNIPLKPHVKETLGRLSNEGKRLFVFTGSSHRYVEPCLRRTGVLDLFEKVMSVDDFPTTKADPAIYRMAADRIGARIEDCLFFDDNFLAVSASVRAGMTTVGVRDASGADFEERMRKTANFYIADLSEIR